MVAGRDVIMPSPEEPGRPPPRTLVPSPRLPPREFPKSRVSDALPPPPP
jgi:hypothetical protein